MFPSEAEPIVLDFIKGLGYAIDHSSIMRSGSLMTYAVCKNDKLIADIVVSESEVTIAPTQFFASTPAVRIPLVDPDCLAKVGQQLHDYRQSRDDFDEQLEKLTIEVGLSHKRTP